MRLPTNNARITPRVTAGQQANASKAAQTASAPNRGGAVHTSHQSVHEFILGIDGWSDADCMWWTLDTTTDPHLFVLGIDRFSDTAVSNWTLDPFGDSPTDLTDDAIVGLPYVFEFAYGLTGAISTITVCAWSGSSSVAGEGAGPVYGTMAGASFTPSAAGEWTVLVTITSGIQVQIEHFTVTAVAFPAYNALPAGTFEDSMGVNIHSQYWGTINWTDLADVASWVRVSSNWQGTELARGTYTWTYLDTPMTAADANGLGVCVCLCYGNTLWTGKSYLKNPDCTNAASEGLRAWLRYCDAVVDRYGSGADRIYEFWNEPGHMSDYYWDDGEDAAGHAMLFRVTAAYLKSRYPDIVISAGSMGLGYYGIPPAAQDLGRSIDVVDAFGGCEPLDYVSIHPYMANGTPERNAINWANDYVPPRPIIITEHGWPLDIYGWGLYPDLHPAPNTETEQALLTVRIFLESMRLGWPLTIIHNWKDDASMGGDYGYLDESNTKREVYDALVVLKDKMAGYTFDSELAAPAGAYALRFVKAGEPDIDVAYSHVLDTVAGYTLPVGAYTMTMAGTVDTTPTDPATLTPEPLYIWVP